MDLRHRYPRDAGLLPRATARTIDATLVLALVTFVVVSLFPARPTTEHALGALRIGGEFDASRVITHATAALLAVGYFTWCEATRGRTFGKAALRLKVIGLDGGPPTMPVAFARNAWMLLPILPWVGTLAMALCAFLIATTILVSRTNTGWHDELAHSAVVAIPSTATPR